MTYKDFIKTMAKNGHISQTTTRTAIEAFCKTVSDLLVEGDFITLKNFGTFEDRQTKPRFINSFGKTNVEVVPHNVPKFRVSKVLRERVKAGV